MVASGSTEEHDRWDNTNHWGDESTQDKSRENVADSDLESASGDCITCSDMGEVATRNAQERFQKKVRAFCSIARGFLWFEAQLRWIKAEEDSGVKPEGEEEAKSSAGEDVETSSRVGGADHFAAYIVCFAMWSSCTKRRIEIVSDVVALTISWGIVQKTSVRLPGNWV